MKGVVSLPHVRIQRKGETERLNNLPENFVQTFYRDWLDGIVFSSDTDFQQETVRNAPSEYVNKFLLATSEVGKLNCT